MGYHCGLIDKFCISPTFSTTFGYILIYCMANPLDAWPHLAVSYLGSLDNYDHRNIDPAPHFDWILTVYDNTLAVPAEFAAGYIAFDIFESNCSAAGLCYCAGS